MIRELRGALLSLACGLAGYVGAQDAALAPGEGQLWLSTELRWHPALRWDLSLAHVLRSFGSIDGVKGSYSYAVVRRRVSEHVDVDGKFRYVNTRTNDHYRAECGVRFRQRFGRDALTFRTAYFHEEPQPFWSEGRPGTADDLWRNRLRFTKDLPKRFSVDVSVETWTRLGHIGTHMQRAAFMTGVQRSLRKGRRVMLDFLYQPEFAVRSPRSMHAFILGAEWDVTKQLSKKRNGRRQVARPVDEGDRD